MKKILPVFVCLLMSNNCFASWSREGISFIAYDETSKVIVCKYQMTGDKITRSISVWFEYRDLLTDSPIESTTLFSWSLKYDSINIKTDKDLIVNGCFRNGIISVYSSNNDIYTIDTRKKELLWSGHSKVSVAGVAINDTLIYIAKKNGELVISSNKTGANIKRISTFLPSMHSIQINQQNSLLAVNVTKFSTLIYDLKSFRLQDSINHSGTFRLISQNKAAYSRADNEFVEYDLQNKKVINRFSYKAPDASNLIGITECEERYLAIELKGSSKASTILIINRLSGEIAQSILINPDFHSTNYHSNNLIAYKNKNLIIVDHVIDKNTLKISGKTKDISVLFYNVQDKKSPDIVILNPVVNPNEQFKTEDDFIFVNGKATDSSLLKTIVINNEQVPFLSLTGEFNGYIKLATGLNELIVKATDIYNNTSSSNIKILKTEKENRGLKIINTNKEYNNASVYVYHALIIAEQDYKDEKIKDLSFPFLDAENLKNILTQYYTFDDKNITLLKNPTRNKIIKSFDSLLNILSTKDHLLIFYAGHGVFDQKLKQGYWLPSDADINNKGTWVSNNDIKDYMTGIDSKHTLLISDACFSGSIFEFNRDVDLEKIIDKLLTKKARTAMTSGLDNPVPDKSVFLQYLLKSLVENKNPFIKASELFSALQEVVLANTENIPQYGVIRNANHEGGEFIFLKKK